MSQSSNAFFGGIYNGSMRHAAPILFCIALTLFIGTIATYWVAYWGPMMDNDPSTVTNIYFMLEGVIRAVKDSALIFAGAAIVWALHKRPDGVAK